MASKEKKPHWTQYRKQLEDENFELKEKLVLLSKKDDQKKVKRIEELEKENLVLKERIVLLSKKEDQRKVKPHYSTYKLRSELLMKENEQWQDTVNGIYGKMCELEKATENLREVWLTVVVYSYICLICNFLQVVRLVLGGGPEDGVGVNSTGKEDESDGGVFEGPQLPSLLP